MYKDERKKFFMRVVSIIFTTIIAVIITFVLAVNFESDNSLLILLVVGLTMSPYYWCYYMLKRLNDEYMKWRKKDEKVGVSVVPAIPGEAAETHWDDERAILGINETDVNQEHATDYENSVIIRSHGVEGRNIQQMQSEDKDDDEMHAGVGALLSIESDKDEDGAFTDLGRYDNLDAMEAENDYASMVKRYIDLDEYERDRFKRKFQRDAAIKFGEKLPPEYSVVNTPQGVGIVDLVLRSDTLFYETIFGELPKRESFDSVSAITTEYYDRWPTLFFELFDQDLISKSDSKSDKEWVNSFVIYPSEGSEMEFIVVSYSEFLANSFLSKNTRYLTFVWEYTDEEKNIFEKAGILPANVEYFRQLFIKKVESDWMFKAKLANSLWSGIVNLIDSKNYWYKVHDDNLYGKAEFKQIDLNHVSTRYEVMTTFEKEDEEYKDLREVEETCKVFEFESGRDGIRSEKEISAWVRKETGLVSHVDFFEMQCAILKEANKNLSDYLVDVPDRSVQSEYSFEKNKKEFNQLSDRLVEVMESSRGILDVFKDIDPYRFEKVVGLILSEKTGLPYSITKQSGDQGVDVILGDGINSTGIQVKRYSENVGNSAVQEIVAGASLNGYSKSMVVTTSGFTKSAKELADANNVELIDGERLCEFLRPFLSSGRFLNELNKVTAA